MARRASAAEDRTNASPDDIAACYAEYCSMRADQARLGQRVAAMLGRYEKLGVVAKTIKDSYSLASKDPNEARANLARLQDYTAILNIITVDETGQSEMSEEIAPRTPKPSQEMQERVELARVYSDGYNSGLAGGDIAGSEKFATGSEKFVRWRDGWDDGHADRLLRNPDADNVTVARPRGRPPGSKNKPKDEAGTETQEEAATEETTVH